MLLLGVHPIKDAASARRGDRRRAPGPEAGEWLQQATLAIRAGIPLEVLRDTIQPFPTFSEAFVNALSDLATRLEESRTPVQAAKT